MVIGDIPRGGSCFDLVALTLAVLVALRALGEKEGPPVTHRMIYIFIVILKSFVRIYIYNVALAGTTQMSLFQDIILSS